MHDQLKEVIGSVDHLEDLIKHSLLKNPQPDLWYGEGEWQHVVGAVASACLIHDVKGIAIKILEGALPKASHTFGILPNGGFARFVRIVEPQKNP